jgi:hypothetical protein
MFVTIADFTGKFELHTGMYDNDKLQAYIDRYEQRYLVHLLGQKYYDEFIGDIDPSTGESRSPNFIKIFNPFYEDENLYSILQSEGFVDMLKGFIYFEYGKDLLNQMTPFGNVKQSSENSKLATTLNTMMYARYNESVRTFNTIRAYILLHYPMPVGQVCTISNIQGGHGYYTQQNVPTSNGIYESGIIAGSTLNNAGTGYVSEQGVLTNPTATGSGCVVDIVDDGAGGVLSYVIIDSGKGYAIGDMISIIGGNGDALIEVTAITSQNTQTAQGTGCVVGILARGFNGVATITNLVGGTGYVTAQNVECTGGTGLGCVVNITAASGVITDVVIVENGNYFQMGDVLTIDGGNGDATFEILTRSHGEIQGIQLDPVNNGGSGYEIGDVIYIDSYGHGASFVVEYVGIGGGVLYNGIHKEYAYWL